MDYRNMTIWELEQEKAKIDAELCLRRGYQSGWVDPRTATASIGDHGFPSLQAALDAALPGDVIVLKSCDGGNTYRLTV